MPRHKNLTRRKKLTPLDSASFAEWCRRHEGKPIKFRPGGGRCHPDEIEAKRAYYAANKTWINDKRRAKYAAEKKQRAKGLAGDPAFIAENETIKAQIAAQVAAHKAAEEERRRPALEAARAANIVARAELAAIRARPEVKAARARAIREQKRKDKRMQPIWTAALEIQTAHPELYWDDVWDAARAEVTMAAKFAREEALRDPEDD